MNASEHRQALLSGAQSARELTVAAQARLDAAAELNASTWTRPDAALVQADALDRLVGMGKPVGPLAGVPFAVKENLAVEQRPHTGGSRVLEGHRAQLTARAVYLLQHAGAIALCGANLDELGIGVDGQSGAAGPTLNPRCPERVPGGSSAGSAALVAAGVVPIALGSDSGGSVRQPASHCGVVGLVGTWGRVSRSGLIGHANSMDRVGVLAGCVRDAALALECISGADAQDPSAAQREIPALAAATERGAQGLRIGVVAEAVSLSSPAVRSALESAVQALQAVGASVSERNLPLLSLGLPAYKAIAAVEAASNLARLDGLRFGTSVEGAELSEGVAALRTRTLGAQVQDRILLGTTLSQEPERSRLLEPALRVREAMRAELFKAFGQVDLLLLPTAPTEPWLLGEGAEAAEEADLFCAPASLAGLPAISVPTARTGAPIGVQLIAPLWDEATLIAAAAALEQALV